MWVLLKDPQSFAACVALLELSVIPVVEETLWQPHTSLMLLSHLYPSLPMLVVFAPGLHPIPYQHNNPILFYSILVYIIFSF